MPVLNIPALGVNTIVNLGGLTAAQVNADPFVVPSKTAVTFTITGAIAAGAVTVAVPALTAAIPAGSAIGIVAAGISYAILVTEDAPLNAASLTILANGLAIPAGGEASFFPMLQLSGGTTSDFNAAGQTQSAQVYDREYGGYAAQATTGQSWTFTYNFVIFANSPGFLSLSYYGVNKTLRLCVMRELEPGAGFTKGHEKGGLCQMSSYTEPSDAQGFVTGTTSFTGLTAPIIIGQS